MSWTRINSPNKDILTPQPFYHFNHTSREWEEVIVTNPPPITAPKHEHKLKNKQQETTSYKIRLITWNIDFQQPAKSQRMRAALEYLFELLPSESSQQAPINKGVSEEDQTNRDTYTIPSVIFLQEMKTSDLNLIQAAPWVRDRFYITDLDGAHWMGSSYGTTTLVEKRLIVQRVFRVHYGCSRMNRDGLFVDIDLHHGSEDEDVRKTKALLLRLCNTHLESLTSIPPRRPGQLKLASEFMHGWNRNWDGSSDTESYEQYTSKPHAAILAGDLNAFAPEDLTAPVECGLEDTFLILGGKDGTEESFTWGQQVSEQLQKKFGCSRMDKMLFCGGIRAEELVRVGGGLKVWVEYPKYENDDEEDEEDGEEMWVTDHLGLLGIFTIME